MSGEETAVAALPYASATFDGQGTTSSGLQQCPSWSAIARETVPTPSPSRSAILRRGSPGLSVRAFSRSKILFGRWGGRFFPDGCGPTCRPSGLVVAAIAGLTGLASLHDQGPPEFSRCPQIWIMNFAKRDSVVCIDPWVTTTNRTP